MNMQQKYHEILSQKLDILELTCAAIKPKTMQLLFDCASINVVCTQNKRK